MFYRIYSYQRSIIGYTLPCASRRRFVLVDCHVLLQKKVTNHPKGSAIKDRIIFTLVL